MLPGGMHFVPVIDGWLLPDRPEALYMQGRHHDVDLIVGSNRDEANFFLAALDLSVEEYTRFVRRMAGESAGEVLRLFPAGEDAQVRPALSRMVTAFEFTAPCRFIARRLADGGRSAYLYHFVRVPPTEQGRILCTCHGSEIPYVFGELDPKQGYQHIDEELSSMIMGYWVNFARGGNPNGAGLPAWPAHRAENDLSLEFGDEIRVRSGMQRDACDLAERIHLAGIDRG